MSGTITPKEAIQKGSVHLTGDTKLLTHFAEIFRIEAMPAKAPA